MKRNFLKVFFVMSVALLSALNLNAQTSNDNTIYSYGDVEEFAEYPGGKDALRAAIIANTVVPQEIIDANAYCTIYVIYVVEKDGTVSNLRVKNPSDDYYVKICEEAAMQAVSKLKNYIPAKIGSEAVRSENEVPVGIMFY